MTPPACGDACQLEQPPRCLFGDVRLPPLLEEPIHRKEISIEVVGAARSTPSSVPTLESRGIGLQFAF
jgi:hypothetical protein